MAARRSYGSYNDGCAAAHALDLIGERWTMIVVRELLLGPKRFSDIQRDVMGIGPAVLTQRLHDLETAVIVQRRRLAGPGRIDVYELTEWGYGLEAVNTALSLWAVGSPALPREADMSPDTVVLAMRAHARAASGSPDERRVALILTDSRRNDAQPVTYLARMSKQRTTIDRSPEPEKSRRGGVGHKPGLESVRDRQRPPRATAGHRRVRQRRRRATADQCDGAQRNSELLPQHRGLRPYESSTLAR